MTMIYRNITLFEMLFDQNDH